MQTNVPAGLALVDRDILFLLLTQSSLDIFPSSLIEGAPLSPSLLEGALKSRAMDPLQLVAAAYFGFLPIARSYRHFCAQAQQRNRQRHDDERDSARLRKDEVARENEAAGECGLSRGEMKRLYQELDRIAVSYGFGSFEAIWQCRGFIEHDVDRASPAERRAYAAGPRFLWDIAKRARMTQMRSVTFRALNDWVLFLHREDRIVRAHAICPAWLRYGGFETPRVSPGSGGVELGIPDEIFLRLCDLAAEIYPECQIDLVPPAATLSLDLVEEA